MLAGTPTPTPPPASHPSRAVEFPDEILRPERLAGIDTQAVHDARKADGDDPNRERYERVSS